MILQKLTSRADPDLVAKALRQKVELSRENFAVVRKVGSEEHYVLRGQGSDTLAPRGAYVTFKEDPRDYKARDPILGEIVDTGRSRHLLRDAAPSILAMLCGSGALFTGIQMALGTGDLKQNVMLGLSVLVAGAFSIGYYVRNVASNELGNFTGEYLNTAIDYSDALRVHTAERHVGTSLPTSSTPEPIEAPAKPLALPAPDHSALIAIPPVNVPVPVAVP